MNCIVCDNKSGFNRVVLETTSGEKLGGLCVGCEADKFGESLDYFNESNPDQCAYCDRDGYYALPRYTAYTEQEGNRTVSKVTFEVGDETLKLCDEHLHILRGEPKIRSTTVPSQ